MRDQFQSPVTPLLMAVVVILIGLTIFAWAWAVRRPAPAGSGEAASSVQTPTAAEPTATPKPLVYAAIGASDVVGVGAADPSTQSWVNVVHDMMPQGTRFVRLGRSGITLHEANQVEVPQAVAAQPDIITLWNVVNDAVQGVSLPSYTADLRSTLDRLTKETRATIVILNAPDLSLLMGSAPAEQRALIQGGVLQWNKAIADTAAQYNGRVEVADLVPVSSEVLAHPEYISPDNFHPSTSGYKRLGQLVFDTIQRDHILDR